MHARKLICPHHIVKRSFSGARALDDKQGAALSKAPMEDGRFGKRPSL
jgi:hypothetical protein